MEASSAADADQPGGDPVGAVVGTREAGRAREEALAARGRNELLSRLPTEEDRRLREKLVPIRLETREHVEVRGETLQAVHFPLDAVVSVVDRSESGNDVEVTTIGNEGVAGMHAFLGAASSPYDTYSQIPGWVLRLGVSDLREFLTDDGALHRLFRVYAQVTIAQLSRNVVCHQLHRAEQRAARWLLMSHDRVGVDEFLLTQEFLATMLGVRRVTVSEVAHRFGEQGLISYTRGRITIVDRPGLERASCSCYRHLNEQVAALYDG